MTSSQKPTNIKSNDRSATTEEIVDANRYPRGFPHDLTKDSTHPSHPMHCHAMQPMQSATSTTTKDETSDRKENPRKT